MTWIAIGGAEDKIGDMTVLRRVLAETGRDKPNVLVITTATSVPAETAKKYNDAFGRLGVTPAIAHVSTRKQAAAPELVEQVKNADVIFFSGGDQLKLATILNATPFFAALKEREAEGAVVAGTSAGAAVMSELMIYGGRNKKGLRKGEVMMAAGFGFVSHAVFDTHFNYEHENFITATLKKLRNLVMPPKEKPQPLGRLPRLFNVVAAAPHKAGIGLDEDTGVIFRGNEFEVIGSGNVTVVDGREADSDVTSVRRGRRITVTGVKVTRYKSGDKFSL